MRWEGWRHSQRRWLRRDSDLGRANGCALCLKRFPIRPWIGGTSSIGQVEKWLHSFWYLADCHPTLNHATIKAQRSLRNSALLCNIEIITPNTGNSAEGMELEEFRRTPLCTAVSHRLAPGVQKVLAEHQVWLLVRYFYNTLEVYRVTLATGRFNHSN